MKVRIPLIALLTITTYFVQAQFSIGIKGGQTIAWEDYNSELPEEAEITVKGYNFALTAHYSLNKHFQIGVEPGMIRRGAACVPGWQPIFEGDTKFFLSYIEMPVFGSLTIPMFKDRLEIFGRLGAGPSYLVKAVKEFDSFLSDPSIIREDMDLGEDSILNRFDFGAYANVGIGYNLPIGQLFAESGYYHGLLDAEKTFYSKNRSYNFNLGYRISL